MPLLRRPHRPQRPHLPSSQRIPTLNTPHQPHPTDDAAVHRALHSGTLTVVGRLTDASNAAILVTVDGLTNPAGHHYAVYKPIAGERPLHDFPTGTPHASLAAREVAAALIDRAGGWNLIPTTVMRDSTLGPGSLQLWIGPPPPGADDTDTPKDPPDPEVVALHPTGHTPPHWLPILDATTADGTPVTLSHADHPTLASLAVLDVVLNNADRKAGHILRETTGDLRAIDHGLTLHHHPKLRTILWGWQGQPLHAADIDRLHQLHTALTSTDLTSTLGALLTDTEIDALHQRTHHLRDNPRYPAPDPHRPAIPWPPL